MEHGNQSRTQHPTEANATSSHSHTVFQVCVHCTHYRDPDTGVCVCVYVHAHTLVCLCVCLQVSMAKLSLTDQEESEHATVTANHGEWMREGSTFTTLC